MIKFLIYITDTGKIVRTGTCPEFMIQDQISDENESIICVDTNDDVTDAESKIIDGKIVAKTTKEMKEPEPSSIPSKFLTQEEYDSIMSRLDALEG